MIIRRLQLFSMAVLFATSVAAAADFPSHPVRIIVPYSPGGVNDLVARISADGLRQRIGQPVVVENRPGGDGIIGVEATVKADADGHTLVIMPGASLVTLPILKKNVPFDPLRDLSPVTILFKYGQFIAVNAELPVKNLQELIAYAKANPGKLNRGTVGTGSLLNEVMIERALGIQGLVTSIPYKGSALKMQALMTNEIQLGAVDSLLALPAVKAGKIRVLAATTLTRQPPFADAPTIAETESPGFEVTSVFGFLAPARTPPEILRRLSGEFAALVKSGPLNDYITSKIAATPVGSTPEEFLQWLRADFAREREAAQIAKIQPE